MSDVVIVEAVRTPIGKRKGGLSGSTRAARALTRRRQST